MKVVNQVQFTSNRKGARAVMDIYDDGSYHVKEVSNCNVGEVPVPASTPVMPAFDGE